MASVLDPVRNFASMPYICLCPPLTLSVPHAGCYALRHDPLCCLYLRLLARAEGHTGIVLRLVGLRGAGEVHEDRGAMGEKPTCNSKAVSW